MERVHQGKEGRGTRTVRGEKERSFCSTLGAPLVSYAGREEGWGQAGLVCGGWGGCVDVGASLETMTRGWEKGPGPRPTVDSTVATAWRGGMGRSNHERERKSVFKVSGIIQGDTLSGKRNRTVMEKRSGYTFFEAERVRGVKSQGAKDHQLPLLSKAKKKGVIYPTYLVRGGL